MKISGGKIDLQNSNSEIMKRRTFCFSNGKIKMNQKNRDEMPHVFK